MGYTTCSRHRRKCCWRCDACPKCDGVRLLRGSYCVECTAKFKAEGAVWVQDYQNYISAEDAARAQPQLDPLRFQKANLAADLGVPVDALRSCSICENYTDISAMIDKPDGRVICPACQKAIEAQTRERDQGALFVTQPALF